MNPLSSSSQMFPRVAAHYVRNHALSNSEFIGEYSLTNAGSCALNDRIHLFGRQFGMAVSFAVRASQLLRHVCTVDQRVASEQVIGPYARRVVALVQHIQRQISECFLITKPVSEHQFPTDADLSVACRADNAGPYPARIRFMNMFPESFTRLSDFAFPRFCHRARLAYAAGWANGERVTPALDAGFFGFNHRLILQPFRA